MYYICAICMIKPKITDKLKSPVSSASKINVGRSLLRLNPVTPARRRILEGIVAPLIDMTPLKDTLLLLCKDCNLLIETMEKFQNTVLKGIQYLLRLHMPQQQHEAVMPVPIPIKEEPEDSLEFDRLDTQKPREFRLQKTSPLPIKKEPEDSIFEDLDELKLSEQDAAARARLLGLTEELHLKAEPASRPPSEGGDSESTLTCDEDCEDYRAVNWEVCSVPPAEALAELRCARAAPAFAAAPLRCYSCALTFPDQPGKDMHDAKHYKTAGAHLCRICSQRLPSALALRGHEAAHLTRYSCRACMLRSAHVDAIKLHHCRVTLMTDKRIVKTNRGATRQTVAKKSRPGARDRDGECEDCRAAHANWTQFAIHYQNVHYDPNKSACYICQRSYVQYSSLANHVREHYTQSKKPQPKRRRRVKRRTKKSSSGAKRKK